MAWTTVSRFCGAAELIAKPPGVDRDRRELWAIGLQERGARFERFQHRADLLGAPEPVEDPGGNPHELPADVGTVQPFSGVIPGPGSDKLRRTVTDDRRPARLATAAPDPGSLSAPRLDSGGQVV